ncbi:MAG: cobaltochelatase CobT-related protein [Gammaproteobacteria bacterium]
MKWLKRRESLHEASVSSLKAISQQKDISSRIGSPLRPPSKNMAQISPVPRSSRNLDVWRAESDFQAFWIKFHSNKITKKNVDPIAQEIIDELEIARVEILGGRELKGAKKNISKYYNKISEEIYDINESTPLIFNLWLKDISGNEVSSRSKNFINDLKNEYGSSAFENLRNEFLNSLDDQGLFYTTSIKLLELTNLIQVDSSNDSNPEDVSESESSNEDNEINVEKEDLTEDDSSSKADILDLEVDIDELDQEIVQTSSEGSIEEEIELGKIEQPEFADNKDLSYKAFTRKYDEIIDAKDLVTAEEALRLRSQLDNLIKPHLTTIGKLANRLQRLLLAQQNTSWNFNLDEGSLDTSRLHRVIAEPGHPLSYKQETENKFKDTVITLLIDNSGSMRGRSISLAAICGDIISSTFERCSVKTEVLGFTTKHWKGGESKSDWISSGNPSSPGRLNDLRHIIYKSADSSWRRSRKFFGAMLREGLLKENVDGEALMWSYGRLIKRQEERKIIIVISDGAPVDDSTLSANGEDYLDMHLKESIKFIESSQNIELQAIGIGHDVNKYYKNAITIHRAEELGEVLLEKLTNLFKAQ